MEPLVINILENSRKNYQSIWIVCQKSSQLVRIESLLREYYGNQIQKINKNWFQIIDWKGTELHLYSLNQKYYEGQTLHTVLACDFDPKDSKTYNYQIAPMLARTEGKTIEITTDVEEYKRQLLREEIKKGRKLVVVPDVEQNLIIVRLENELEKFFRETTEGINQLPDEFENDLFWQMNREKLWKLLNRNKQ